jgi:hypothetical protein
MPALRAAFAWSIVLPLAVFAWLIAWFDRAVGARLPFPRNLDALSKRRDWLPAGVTAAEVRVRPISATVAFRSDSGFVEVLDADGKTVELFAKFAPSAGSIWNRAIFNIQGNAGKETRFNAAFSNDPTVPAPRAWFAKSDGPTGNLCLVTEKMTGATEYQEDDASLSAEHIDAALDGLARLHARFWNRTPKEVEAIPRAVVDWFDSLVRFSWGRAARTLLVESWVHMNAAQTVLHGDARIGNMLFGERFVLIDWQAVRLGLAAFDLAYFLTLSLTTPRREELEARAIATYHARLVAHGVTGYSQAQLEEDYRHGVLCVLVLLSLPLLSGEASADAEAAQGFVYGMGLWRERLARKLQGFDFEWVSRQYGISADDAKAAVAEMLGTIDRRLERIRLRART